MAELVDALRSGRSGLMSVKVQVLSSPPDFMDRLNTLSKKVADLYNSKFETRDEWADWLYPNHVLAVEKFAEELAKRYGAGVELSRAAALLHDIADYKLSRSDDKHEEESIEIAQQLLLDSDYSQQEIGIIVDDAIRFHSCHGGKRPKTLEGLVLASADSMAHLKTDFYLYAVWAMAKEQSLQASKDWTLKKIDRDLNDKISFDDLREELRPDYEAIKTLFSR